ncbi:hypothetical protein G9A89_008081 [Geosiphon pyriformis]|nr:hypothetical protein G9A89_008081 [Geosiphon pyriformis]
MENHYRCLNGLSTDFSKLLENADDYNVIITVGDIQQRDNFKFAPKQFQAHSVILRARCLYFQAALSNHWAKKEMENFILTMPNTSPDVFELILKYVYGGEVRISQETDIVGLLETADELGLEELFSHAEDHLIRYEAEWIYEHLFKVSEVAFKLPTAEKLRVFCLDMITCSSENFFKKEEFLSTNQAVLIAILQQEEIKIDEEQMWQHVLAWGIANTSSIEHQNIRDLNNESLLELRETVQPLLRYIRFIDIPSSHVINNQSIFEKLLPSELWLELKEYYSTNILKFTPTLLPPRSRLSSQIIRKYHSDLIANWIEGPDYTETGNIGSPYIFRLIFRASLEDFSLKNLQKEYLNVPIIIVAKVAGTEEIIGGYTPTLTSDRKNKFITTRDSFIFSFASENNRLDFNQSFSETFNEPRHTKNTLSRVQLDCWERAVTDIFYGFLTFGMSDLRIGGILNPKSGFCRRGIYDRRIRNVDGGFLIEEYELFQVIRIRT